MSSIESVRVNRSNQPKPVDVKNLIDTGMKGFVDINVERTPPDVFNEDPDTYEPEETDLGLDMLANKDREYPESDRDDRRDETFHENTEIPQSNYDDNFSVSSMTPKMTHQQIQEKKAFYLHQLDRCIKKGIQGVRRLGMNQTLQEIEAEFRRVKKEIEIDTAIDYGKQGLMFCVKSIEMLNNQFDPLGARLDGWSHQMYTELGSYDDVFEELYEKYHDKVQMMPELRLLFAVSASGLMFHIQKTFVEKASQNENMMSSLANAMNNLQGLSQPRQTPKQKEMRGPSMDTEALLAKLQEEADNASVSGDSDNGSLNINLQPDSVSVSVPGKKSRGRPKKNA